MTKSRLVAILGVCVLLLPFLGLPGVWKAFFTFALGLAIAIIAVMAGRGKKRPHYNMRRRREVVTDVFVEGGPVSPRQAKQEKEHTPMSAAISPFQPHEEGSSSD